MVGGHFFFVFKFQFTKSFSKFSFPFNDNRLHSTTQNDDLKLPIMLTTTFLPENQKKKSC